MTIHADALSTTRRAYNRLPRLIEQYSTQMYDGDWDGALETARQISRSGCILAQEPVMRKLERESNTGETS